MKTAVSKPSDRVHATRDRAELRRRWLNRIFPAAVSVGALSWLFLYGGIAFEDILETMTWKIGFILFPAQVVYGAIALLLEAQASFLLLGCQCRQMSRSSNAPSSAM